MAIDRQATWFAWQNPNWDGNAITTGSSATSSSNKDKRNSNERDNSAASQMLKDRLETAKRQYAKAAAKDNSAWYQKSIDDTAAEGNSLQRAINNRDNSAGWQKVRDNPEQYQNDALEQSYATVQELISRYDEAVKAEDKASQYIGALYSSEGAEENLASAQAHRKAIADELAIYGVGTNGTQVDASSFYNKYFGEQTKKAKEEKDNEPIDIVGLLTGLESSYSANKGKQRLTFASDDENLTYEYLKKQDALQQALALTWIRHLQGFALTRL